jgi:branched-chain amino acid transport system ATP-binding protein
MSNVIEITNLSGGYGPLHVFRDVSLSVPAGLTVGIYGANGAGKTTLMRTIVGLLPSKSGAVVLDGADITSLPAYQRVRTGLALVPEGRQILGSLTVEDNLRLVRAAWKGTVRKNFDAELNGVFEMFPRLKERAHQVAGSLSGGEQQMLAIGRAILVRPSILMLDEPTQGLAPVIVKELSRVLALLKRQFSMIVVEQNRVFLDEIADTKYEMRAGRCRPFAESADIA